MGFGTELSTIGIENVLTGIGNASFSEGGVVFETDSGVTGRDELAMDDGDRTERRLLTEGEARRNVCSSCTVLRERDLSGTENDDLNEEAFEDLREETIEESRLVSTEGAPSSSL